MQKTAIHETLFLHGLCATCRNAPGCTYSRSADVPVQDCLEFDGEQRAAEARPARATPAERNERRRAGELGMCAWCDNRVSCTFPRNPGGTWLCEEYQ